MQLDIVTPDRRVVVGETSDVIIPGIEGEFEVLPGHAPLLTILGTGILSFKQNGKDTRLVVSGGFVEIDGDRITLMAESASLAGEVVREEANKQLYDAEQKLKQLGAVSVENEDFQVLRAEVDRAAAKLTLIR
jgi:F-type H+-transporting ATPase subunit epsilon